MPLNASVNSDVEFRTTGTKKGLALGSCASMIMPIMYIWKEIMASWITICICIRLSSKIYHSELSVSGHPTNFTVRIYLYPAVRQILLSMHPCGTVFRIWVHKIKKTKAWNSLLWQPVASANKINQIQTNSSQRDVSVLCTAQQSVNLIYYLVACDFPVPSGEKCCVPFVYWLQWWWDCGPE